MPAPLVRDIQWLTLRLAEVETDPARAEVERARAAAASMLDAGALDPALAALDGEAIHGALKILTIRFHLRNKAEQVHIARVNRRRERDATPESPRPESLDEAVGALARGGVPLNRLLETLAEIDIRPTLTAHPTESRRRSVMQKQALVADLLAVHDDPDATPTEHARAESALRQTLALLLATDEVRAQRLEVIDEVRNGVHYLAGAIWDAVPVLHRDLVGAIERHYGERPDLPVFLRYRSWIGGDRDGNPNVTADLTRRAFDEMRAAALDRHAEALDRLHQDLSVSERRVPIDPRLLASIERDEAERPLDPDLVRHLRHEPFRVKIRHMQARLGDRAYSAARFIADLETLRDALAHAGLDEAAARGPLADALVRARTFGFHLAALDIRQHSRVHESAVAEMLRLAGVEADYASLDEPARVALLRDELATARPLLARRAEIAPATRELLDTLAVIADAAEREPESVGSWIISMAHDVSDLLEVIVLLREAGLWTIDGGRAACPVDIAPLFETVDDLDAGARVMRDAFGEPAYRAHLSARSNFQAIMLGYSDSNKDGGYWAANWRLHRAQDELARTCRDAGVAFRYFHGRGGTVARGGGRAHRAILASPPASRNGKIRFTEQGEVISFRYAMPALARRHLEQIANAMLLATADAPVESASDDDAHRQMMEALAERSRAAYRELIDDPDFWPAFVDRSPVLHIGELPIASRPVSRAGGQVRFENLRAIPWVFAWTQMRYNAPGWYGVGSAFEEIVMRDNAALERCRGAYAAGGHFRAFIDNAQQEMARARLAVARWYTGDGELHARLAAEYARAERAVLAITGQNALLDNNPVIQQSIRERNPDTDAINALQVELLRRWRESSDDQKPALRRLILLSVNALAAAMQSTG
ncbi:MAG: phosphoenolpyruvate carboxylase [Phycisphaerales bacterium]